MDKPFGMYDEVEESPPELSCVDEMERNPPVLPCSDRMGRNLSVPAQLNVTAGASGHRTVPLSQLWEEFQAERTVFLDDYFEEIQRKIDSGESLFSSVLPPLEEELQLEEGDSELFEPSIEALFADFGIDADGTQLHRYQFMSLNIMQPLPIELLTAPSRRRHPPFLPKSHYTLGSPWRFVWRSNYPSRLLTRV